MRGCEFLLPFVVTRPIVLGHGVLLSGPQCWQGPNVAVNAGIVPGGDTANVVRQNIDAEITYLRVISQPFQHLWLQHVDRGVRAPAWWISYFFVESYNYILII